MGSPSAVVEAALAAAKAAFPLIDMRKHKVCMPFIEEQCNEMKAFQRLVTTLQSIMNAKLM